MPDHSPVQCSNCGFMAFVPEPRLLGEIGWRLQSEGRPGTYCPECAKSVLSREGNGVTPLRTRAAGAQ
jgi:hypothetical protein